MHHELDALLTEMNRKLKHLQTIQTLAQKDDNAEVSAYEYAWLTCEIVDGIKDTLDKATQMITEIPHTANPLR